MIRFLADENFDYHIVRGVRRQFPVVDIVSIKDVELQSTDDPTILAWAATEGRVVLTHDVQTMTKYAIERIELGLPMPGLIEVALEMSVGAVISELILIVKCGIPDDLNSQILYLPVR